MELLGLGDDDVLLVLVVELDVVKGLAVVLEEVVLEDIEVLTPTIVTVVGEASFERSAVDLYSQESYE